MTALSTLLAFGLGAFAWTFFEYCLHRFGGHLPKGKTLPSREHLAHHTDPTYFTSYPKKLASAVPVLGGVGALALLGGGPAVALGLVVGFASGWWFYEVLHRGIHRRAPRSAYGHWARRHHLHHHFARPFRNHGVTTSLWDHVFGTYDAVREIKIPRRHARELPWLFEPGGADRVRPELAGIYRVGGS